MRRPVGAKLDRFARLHCPYPPSTSVPQSAAIQSLDGLGGLAGGNGKVLRPVNLYEPAVSSQDCFLVVKGGGQFVQSSFELLRGHFQRAKIHVKEGALPPVAGLDQPSCIGQPAIEGCAGERGLDSNLHVVEAGFFHKGGNEVEHFACIAVEPENKASVDRDAMVLNPLDRGTICVTPVVLPIRAQLDSVQASSRRGFQAD